MSMETSGRILPVGLQSFAEIRQTGTLYVDKTGMVWELAHNGKFNYLSRPRRFGKSLLVGTLQCYFEGRRELFDGLKIMGLEKEWRRHPVIRLDMNGGGSSEASLRSYLNTALKDYEEAYGMETSEELSFGVRLSEIIKKSAKETGERAVILVDEYDSPLLHTWGTPEHEPCRRIYQDFFNYLKIEDANERFVFITGVTNFSHVSIFSTLNNLNNISFDPEYATLCGMTRAEIEETFAPEIESLAATNRWSRDEALAQMKEYYDGYHFSDRNMEDVYNPFSVVLALSKRRIGNYWVGSGSTSLIPSFVSDLALKVDGFDNCPISAYTLESSDVMIGKDEIFLYQAGYLTIKGYDARIESYTLGYPNCEVRTALYEVVVPMLASRPGLQMDPTLENLRTSLLLGDMDKAKTAFKALLSDVPYSNISLQAMKMEERYRFLMSCFMKAVGVNVQVERQVAGGRIDIVATNCFYVYVMELKLRKAGGLAAAERQIADCGYADAFRGAGRPVVPLAVELDDEGRGIIDWKRVG